MSELDPKALEAAARRHDHYSGGGTIGDRNALRNAKQIITAYLSTVSPLSDGDGWQDISSAPKGGGAEMVTDPAWVEPPRILLFFPEYPDGDSRNVAHCYWDWYYALGGNGYREGCSGWVVVGTAETTDLHFSTQPTHWCPIPAPPRDEVK